MAFAPDGSLAAAACFEKHGAADCFRVDLLRPDKPNEKKRFPVGDYGRRSARPGTAASFFGTGTPAVRASARQLFPTRTRIPTFI